MPKKTKSKSHGSRALVDPRDVLGMHIAIEALSCAVMSAHRARVCRLPKHLKKRVEKAHATLVKAVSVLGVELCAAITEKSR